MSKINMGAVRLWSGSAAILPDTLPCGSLLDRVARRAFRLSWHTGGFAAILPDTPPLWGDLSHIAARSPLPEGSGFTAFVF